MIHTAKQLKDLVRNRSGGDSLRSQLILRNYMMERFLERLALSRYRDCFILKGGLLLSAIVGLDNRSTMDIDTTLKGHPLSVEGMENILAEILSVHVDDGISFSVKSISEIMDEAEYGGVRASLEAMLDTMRTPLKIDVSTGDAITPGEVEFPYKLMFEDRSISVLAYNLETVIAEKLETILSRGTANTRMRDFYDLYILTHGCKQPIDGPLLGAALEATATRRGTLPLTKAGKEIVAELPADEEMRRLWTNYQMRFSYAAPVSWVAAVNAVRLLLDAASG